MKGSNLLESAEYWRGIINKAARESLCDRAALAEKVFARHIGDYSDLGVAVRQACSDIITAEMEGDINDR